MASAASSSWLSMTERRLQDLRHKDIEGSGLARWHEASKVISDFAGDGPSLERSQYVLNELRKDFGSKKLQFDPHRFTFVVEGRPVQVHVSYRLLQGSGGTLVGSRSPSSALLGSFSRRSAFLELKTDIGDNSSNISPWPFPELTLPLDAQVLVLTHEDATWTEQLPYMASRCAPVQVVECFGRAARREPPCPTEECVFNWWKELS